MKSHATITITALLLAFAVWMGGCDGQPVAFSLIGDSTAVGLDKSVNANDGDGAPRMGVPVASADGVGEDGVPLRDARNKAGKRSNTRNQGNRAIYNLSYTTTSSFEDLARLFSKEGGGAIGLETPIATGDNANQTTGGQDASGDREAGSTDQSGGE